ncbi:MAG: glycoside hydrolase family 57 protein [Mariprofundaceae bacterium]|nr:glycoside hydrolase family 57 protein [Mariprofundaceae bacterium]
MKKQAPHKLSVVFCWHMHQPFYRDAESGRYALPWVYLHAMKDYTDMAAILEQVPGARAVINFVPSLTVQIQDYADRIHTWLDHGGALPDPLLDALAHQDGNFSHEERNWLLKVCFRLNHERNLHRYPAYSRLWHLAEQCRHHGALDYLGDNYFTDLVTWYHLAWLGETVRNTHFVARRLIEKASDFSHQDRRDLMTLIASLLADVPVRYRKLAEEGKIELSTTPYAHPIIPLQLDFEAALETVPDAEIPDQPYPGGAEQAQEHIDLAKRKHAEVFGHPARGCWPAEGAVSQKTVEMLGNSGFDWCATGEGVLHHSLGYNLREQQGGRDLYHPWRVGKKGNISCFFRDDRLSDLIGFEYQSWGDGDAAANFIHELAGIHHRMQGETAPVVSIIMDGENAWEHFSENGLPFLTALYQGISEHEAFALTTFSDYLAQHHQQEKLKRLAAGSWVYGNLSTWIGDAAKTRAWALLIDAKKAFDAAKAAGKLNPEQLAAAAEQLRICEGSDWCWWFGDYNPGPAVRDFDLLYRCHLRKLYQLIGQLPPNKLETPISEGGGDAEGGGTMRRGN